jgi:hypothetical protein
VLGQATGNTGNSGFTTLTTARTQGSHHLPPYIILCASPRHPHPNGFLSRDSQWGVPKLSRFGLSQLCGTITLCSDLWLGRGPKQSYSSRRELSNGVLHFTYTHRGRVDSWLLVVKSQTAKLTPDLSFCHNLCCRCPNGSCEPIFDIYTLITFQWYKERFNARCFDPCNRTLKFWKPRRTPKSPFQECEYHPHTLSKLGCNTNTLPSSKYEVSNTLKRRGLTYNTIDACVKGCMLFQNNYANVDQCIKCGEPRY